MASIEDIERTITGYGYLLTKPKKISPSYYRIVEDETIIEALIRIETVVENTGEELGYAVRISNNVKAYVSKEKRKPELFVPIQLGDITSGIVEEDLQTEELSSEFSEYELSNGSTVNIRTIVSQINKTKFYSQDGEPIYSVNTTPIIKFKSKR